MPFLTFFSMFPMPSNFPTQISDAASPVFTDLSPFFLFLVGVFVALLALSALIGWLKH